MSVTKSFTTMVVCFTVWLGTGCAEDQSAELVSVRSEKDAIEILDELDRAAVYAEKVSKTEQRQTVWAIQVPREKLSTARKVLLQSGLPRDTHGGYQEMLDKSGMFPNKTDERARLMRAQSEELATTLEQYDGIIGARVHVIVPEKERTRGYSEPPTASVMIRYAPLEKDGSTGEKRARASDPYPYSVPVPPAPVETVTSGAATGDTAGEDPKPNGESPSRTAHPRSTDEGPSRRAEPPVGEGVRRDLEKNWNSDWPLTPSAVCWQVANGVEGLDPWNVTVMYSRAPTYHLPASVVEKVPPEAEADPGSSKREKLYKAATAFFGITTILLAFLHIRLRRRLD